MNILILGATGFIGKSIFHSLLNKHQVIAASRNPIDGLKGWKQIDFNKNNDWESLLENIDIVINAVGIVDGDFKLIQTSAPLALYKVCKEKGIKVIHISALGAEKENPPTEFLKSKKVTDDFLLHYENTKVIYPGIVIGAGGESSKFFTELAQLPIIPITKTKNLPLVHITQLTDLVVGIVDDFDKCPKQVFAVAKAESIKKLLNSLKGKPGRYITVPNFILVIFFSLFPKAKIGIFNKQMLQLMNTICTSDYSPMFDSACDKIVASQHRQSDVFPQLFALLAISFIWFWSGFSSLVSWDESYEITRALGVEHTQANAIIYLGSFTDIILAIAIFSKKHRKKVLIIQIMVMVAYMIILSIFSPGYWLHPFGVLAKNIPLLALTYYLYRNS